MIGDLLTFLCTPLQLEVILCLVVMAMTLLIRPFIAHYTGYPSAV